jgi:hypothetical protein
MGLLLPLSVVLNHFSTIWFMAPGWPADLVALRPPRGNSSTIFFDALSDLPSVAQFSDLHITDNLASAVKSLKGLAGIYAIRCTITGAIYIGSSINLGKRLRDHFTDSTNIHLRNAMVHYGA